jgi:hypothetical protein
VIALAWAMPDIAIKRDVASGHGILLSTIDNMLDDTFWQRIVSTMYGAEPMPRGDEG